MTATPRTALGVSGVAGVGRVYIEVSYHPPAPVFFTGLYIDGGRLCAATARDVREGFKRRRDAPRSWGVLSEPGSFSNPSFLGFAGNGGCFWIFLHAGVHSPVSVLRLVHPKALLWTWPGRTGSDVLNRKEKNLFPGKKHRRCLSLQRLLWVFIFGLFC